MPRYQFPNRDRRKDVTTLKSAAAHGPRFLTGSDATKKAYGRSPPGRIITPTVSLATGGKPSRDGFLRCRAPFSRATILFADD